MRLKFLTKAKLYIFKKIVSSYSIENYVMFLSI